MVTTPQVTTNRLRRKNPQINGKGDKSVNAHNIFYDTNHHDNTNILDVDMSQEQEFVDIDTFKKPNVQQHSSNVKFNKVP